MSHNTVIHQIVRPMVRAVAPTGITPNVVTALRLVTGLAAAACFARGGYGWMSAGAAVFVVSMLLDRADGELARQTNQMSLAGYRFDLFSDCIASVATFLGLGIGVANAEGGTLVWLGALAGVGIAVLFLELNVLKIASVRAYSLFGLSVDPDDAMIFVPLLVWAGLALPMVVAAAVITPLAAVAVGLLSLRRKPA